jgi:thioredoxin-related protein
MMRPLMVIAVLLGAVAVISTPACQQETSAPAPDSGANAPDEGDATEPDDAAAGADDDEAAAGGADADADAAAGAVVWHTTLEAALKEARQKDSLVIVDAWADWCGWCHKLDRDTLAKENVQKRLKDFALFKLDTDANSQLARKFQVRGLPTTLVLDKNGEVITSKSGYMPPDAYLAFIDSAVKQAD